MFKSVVNLIKAQIMPIWSKNLSLDKMQMTLWKLYFQMQYTNFIKKKIQTKIK